MRLIDADALKEKMIGTDRYFNIVFDIDEAPTVEVNKWMPVKERLPEIGEKVFLTIRMHHDHSLATVKGVLKEKGVWGIVDEIIFIYDLAFYDYDVIAWMPQFERPEPYRESEE